MDPVTLIVTALVSGAAAAAKDTASEAIKDAYGALKGLIARRFSGKPDAELALTKHEEKPEVWDAPLRDALVEAGLEKDSEAVKLAQLLMMRLDPDQAKAGKYNTTIHGNVQGWVQDNTGEITMNFGRS